MLILLGIIDIGRVFYTDISVANAARAGAQHGAQSVTLSADLIGMQQAALKDGQNIPGITATAIQFCQCPDGTSASCTKGNCGPEGSLFVYVQVTTQAQAKTLFPWPGIPSSFNLTGRTVMRAQ